MEALLNIIISYYKLFYQTTIYNIGDNYRKLTKDTRERAHTNCTSYSIRKGKSYMQQWIRNKEKW